MRRALALLLLLPWVLAHGPFTSPSTGATGGAGVNEDIFFWASGVNITGSSNSARFGSQDFGLGGMWPIRAAGSITRISCLFEIVNFDIAGEMGWDVHVDGSSVWTPTATVAGDGPLYLLEEQPIGTDTVTAGQRIHLRSSISTTAADFDRYACLVWVTYD